MLIGHREASRPEGLLLGCRTGPAAVLSSPATAQRQRYDLKQKDLAPEQATAVEPALQRVRQEARGCTTARQWPRRIRRSTRGSGRWATWRRRGCRAARAEQAGTPAWICPASLQSGVVELVADQAPACPHVGLALHPRLL